MSVWVKDVSQTEIRKPFTIELKNGIRSVTTVIVVRPTFLFEGKVHVCTETLYSDKAVQIKKLLWI